MLQSFENSFLQQQKLIQTQKLDKEEERHLRERIRTDYKERNPYASKEKIQAAAFRISKEQIAEKLKIVNVEPSPLFYPNISQTTRRNYKFEFYHSGVWQEFKNMQNDNEDIEGKGEKEFSAWSCCMNQNYNSKGCCRIKNNRDRWIYESYQQN